MQGCRQGSQAHRRAVARLPSGEAAAGDGGALPAHRPKVGGGFSTLAMPSRKLPSASRSTRREVPTWTVGRSSSASGRRGAGARRALEIRPSPWERTEASTARRIG